MNKMRATCMAAYRFTMNKAFKSSVLTTGPSLPVYLNYYAKYNMMIRFPSKVFNSYYV